MTTTSMKTRSDARDAALRQPPRLTVAQEAAVAKLAYAAEHAGAVALLCGPAGVGKTTVLRHVAAVGIPAARTLRLCGACGCGRWQEDESVDDQAADVLLVDDADHATATELVGFVDSRLRRQPAVVIVLAGQGRLLSLCSGDRRLEQRVRLRATLPTFTIAESREVLVPKVASAADEGRCDEIVRTIHEIAGGVPDVALRLADMASVLAAADPARRLVPDDIETIHRRLSMQAA